MKPNRLLLLQCIIGASLIGLASCRNTHKKITITPSRVEMTAHWDTLPDEKAVAVFAPYKAKVDSIMNPVIGHSAIDMSATRPESLLSNLVADVLRNAATPYTGSPADVGIMNIGGLRNSLSAGEITYRSIYEILPFENSLCVLTLKGKDLKDLLADIMKAGGEGLSNVRVTINKNKDIIDLKVGNKPVEDERLYDIATLDYLAEGNDRMTAFTRAVKRTCDEKATIRGIFIDYVKAEAAKGRSVTAKIEGRVTIQED